MTSIDHAPAATTRAQSTKWISPARASKFIGCCRSQVICMLEDGRLRGFQDRPGAWWKVDWDSVKEYIARMRGVAVDSEPSAR